jgi:hypothetical protein
MRFVVTRGSLRELVVEALVLFDWIVELAKGVAELEPSGKNLEPLYVIRVVWFLL